MEDDAAGYVGKNGVLSPFYKSILISRSSKGKSIFVARGTGPGPVPCRCPARVCVIGAGDFFFFFCFPRINKIYRCFRLQLVMPPEHICVRIGAAREWPRETMLWRADREKKKIQIIAHAIRVIRVPDGSPTTSRCRDRTSCRLGRMHRRLHPNCVPTTTTKNKFVFIEMFLKILYGIY